MGFDFLPCVLQVIGALLGVGLLRLQTAPRVPQQYGANHRKYGAYGYPFCGSTFTHPKAQRAAPPS
jgi:hypothetical protein